MSDTALILYKWRVYCQDESAYQYWWLDQNQSEPTTCPNNSAHTITTVLTKIVQTRNAEVFEIKQEATPTGGNYMWDTQVFTALADQITEFSFSYPMDVSVLEAQFTSGEENVGDTWSWVISPNTTVGALTANVAIDDTVINVTSTVTANINVGFYVNLFDGVNTEELGRVLSIDSVSGTITTENASTTAFSAASPTYVRMNIYFMKDAEFGHPWNIVYGEGKILSSFVPAGTTVKVMYNNKSPTVDKRVVCNLEILY